MFTINSRGYVYYKFKGNLILNSRGYVYYKFKEIRLF